MKTLKAILSLILSSVLLFCVSCSKDDDDNQVKPVDIAEFVGQYPMGKGSYRAPLTPRGELLEVEKQSIEGEIVNVSRGKGDTLILSSETLGTIKVLAKVEGQRVNLTIPEQFYNGYFNFTGSEGFTIKTDESFFFAKEPKGKYFDSKSGNGVFEVSAKAAGNRYQVGIRRTGIN